MVEIRGQGGFAMHGDRVGRLGEGRIARQEQADRQGGMKQETVQDAVRIVRGS
jgi:hypothetical protein